MPFQSPKQFRYAHYDLKGPQGGELRPLLDEIFKSIERTWITHRKTRRKKKAPATNCVAPQVGVQRTSWVKLDSKQWRCNVSSTRILQTAGLFGLFVSHWNIQGLLSELLERILLWLPPTRDWAKAIQFTLANARNSFNCELPWRTEHSPYFLTELPKQFWAPVDFMAMYSLWPKLLSNVSCIMSTITRRKWGIANFFCFCFSLPSCCLWPSEHYLKRGQIKCTIYFFAERFS